MYEKLRAHVGHNVACVAYGDINNPVDICIECEDCCEVLVSAVDFDIDELIVTPESLKSNQDFDENEVVDAFNNIGCTSFLMNADEIKSIIKE